MILNKIIYYDTLDSLVHLSILPKITVFEKIP
jgi:hypothetical protein